MRNAGNEIPDTPIVNTPPPEAPAEIFADAIRRALPDDERAFIGAIVTLQCVERSDIGDQIIAGAFLRFPLSQKITHISAVRASAVRDWAESLIRWRQLYQLLPNNAEAIAGIGKALRRIGDLNQAESFLNAAIEKYSIANPDYTLNGAARAMTIEHALVATDRQDWRAALQRWQPLVSAFPNDFALNALHRETLALYHMANAQDAAANANATRAELTSAYDLLTDTSGDQVHKIADLMRGFENLGTNCDFGFVQRHCGIEPLGLLRWSSTDPKALITALNTRFEGVGHPDFTRLTLRHDEEYSTSDTRFGMKSHTFIRLGAQEPELLFAQLCRRLRYLAGKLIDDLKSGEKIFVYRRKNLIDNETIMNIHQELTSYHPDNFLLCVTVPGAHGETAPIEILNDQIMIAYMPPDNLRPPGPSAVHYLPAWEIICRAAHRFRSNGTPPDSTELTRLEQCLANCAPPAATITADTEIAKDPTAADARANQSAARWAMIMNRIPKHDIAYAGAMTALLQISALDIAKLALRDGANLFPGEPVLHLMRARTAVACEDWTEALACWQTVLKHAPENLEAIAAAAEISSRLGHTEKNRVTFGDTMCGLSVENASDGAQIIGAVDCD